jgi:hypothetical protein
MKVTAYALCTTSDSMQPALRPENMQLKQRITIQDIVIIMSVISIMTTWHLFMQEQQLALFYVGLAACQMAREEKENVEYIELAAKNLLELGKYLEPAGINIGTHWQPPKSVVN